MCFKRELRLATLCHGKRPPPSSIDYVRTTQLCPRKRPFSTANQRFSSTSGEKSGLKGHLLPRDKQALREGPLQVHPLGVTTEADTPSHVDNLVGGVFVGALGPDGFIFGEFHGETGLADADGLVASRAEMHFDAALHLVVPHGVAKPREVKIGIELAVDARQQIQIERSRDPGGIVVGNDQLWHRLYEVRAQ